MIELEREQLSFPFSARWSARAFKGEPLREGQLDVLCGAIRWSPSGGNQQPWRFFVALHGTPVFDRMNAEVLDDGNRVWCPKAAALFTVASKVELSAGYKFESGIATQSLILQAVAIGLYAHPMGGFDPNAACRVLDIGDGLEPLCVIAIGHPAAPETLPTEKLQARERKRSPRKPLEEIIFIR